MSDTAVHKAIKSGRITALPDGTIDAARADADWDASTDPAQSSLGTRGRPARARAATPTSMDDRAGGAPTSNSYAQARTANEVLKAQHHKLRIAQLRGELIDRQQAVGQIFALARAERDAWLNWPARISSMLAAELDVDPRAMHVALEREVRQHLSELGDFVARLE